MADSRPLGELYPKLKVLERRLAAWRIDVELNADTLLDSMADRQGEFVIAHFHGNLDKSGVMYLRANPTRYEVLHELAHALDFRKNPSQWINAASTRELAGRLREQAAYNRLRNSRSWWRFNLAERLHAIRYVDDRGGQSKIDLQTGRTVNQFKFT